MNTDLWASIDQYTSFAKEPFGFSRPENFKEHSLLSKATFVEWPNTTCDFSLHSGVAPAGKLAPHQPSFSTSHGHTMQGASSSSPSAGRAALARDKRSFAISDAQLRASVRTDNNGARSPKDVVKTAVPRATPKAVPRATPKEAPVRNSADNVTCAYTLLQKAASQQNTAHGNVDENKRQATPTRKGAGLGDYQGTVEASPQRQEVKLQQDIKGRQRKPSAASYDWSVQNIGFCDIKSAQRIRLERENRDGYVRASFASRDADRPYIAEATHFQFRYPHTFGRIQALSKVRSDRVDTLPKERVGPSYHGERRK